MRTLVTGAAGFVGRYLLDELARHGHALHGVDAPGCTDPGMREVDVRREDALDALVRELRPEACVHLAALAFVPRAWEEPALAFQVNTVGTMNLLAALRRHAPECRVLVVSSSQVYGAYGEAGKAAEEAPVAPASLYAISKTAADLGALAFGSHHAFPVMTARPTNHIGPGQGAEYVASAFARKVARIAKGLDPPVLRVGNLESVRSFLDVRDVVHAYRLLLDSGVAGRAYNIAAAEMHRVGDVLDMLCNLAGVEARVESDPVLYRPADRAVDLSTDRIRADTGWAPRYSLRRTLADILEEAMQAAGL